MLLCLAVCTDEALERLKDKKKQIVSMSVDDDADT